MGNTHCGCQSQQLSLESFNLKNKYDYVAPKYQPDNHKQIIQLLAPTISHQSQYNGISYQINTNPDNKFVDKNFMILELAARLPSDKEHLHKLYNYQQRKISRVFESKPTNTETFYQRQLQLTYLVSVLYFLAKNAILKQSIFETVRINSYGVYLLRLFCNGKVCEVIVDDQVPIQGTSIKYLKCDGNQIWPYLLQKAWCKQIGGYDKAFGLSPQDCFQEITGIPAKSFLIIQFTPLSISIFLSDCLKKGYWIALTSSIMEKSHNTTINTKQVFIIEKVQNLESDDPEQQVFHIRSPYLNQKLENSRILTTESRTISLQQLINNFKYVTIGYYQKQFELYSITFVSPPEVDIIWSLKVHQPIAFNLRFIQFYREYLNVSQRNRYQYSPILIQIYNQDFILMDKCQVFNPGARSVSLPQDGLLDLVQGQYYIRVRADWKFSDIKTGTITIYANKRASRPLYQLKKVNQCTHIEIIENDFCRNLLAGSLYHPSAIKIQRQSQKLVVRVLEKSYSYLIGIINVDEIPVSLEIRFTGSRNIKLKHKTAKLEDKTVKLKLEVSELCVLEIIPENMNKLLFLAPFDIVKL